MSLNPLAPAFLSHCQSSSDPPISLGNSTKNFPLAQIICGITPQIVPSNALFIRKHLIDSTLLLPLLQPTSPSKPAATAHQPTPESSALLSSPLQHQAICLQAVHKTIQQFNQHLKAENSDRQALKLIALQLQTDFVLLRYLLFSDKDSAAKDATTSPLVNPNPYPNLTSSAFTLPYTDDAKLRRSTPVGAAEAPSAKTNNSANADFQPTLNTQEAHPTTVQNLTSRICKTGKIVYR